MLSNNEIKDRMELVGYEMTFRAILNPDHDIKDDKLREMVRAINNQILEVEKYVGMVAADA